MGYTYPGYAGTDGRGGGLHHVTGRARSFLHVGQGMQPHPGLSHGICLHKAPPHTKASSQNKNTHASFC